MKTTELIVEPFIGGALLLAAVLFEVWSWFPAELTQFLKSLQFFSAGEQPKSAWGLAAAVTLAAVAYSLGIITENFSRSIFEAGMRGVKLHRFEHFIKQSPDLFQQNSTVARMLKQSPGHNLGKESTRRRQVNAVLCSILGIGHIAASNTPGLHRVERVLGLMRFSIMSRNPNLSKEIESHVSRMRLMRILAVVQIVFLIALLRVLWRTSHEADLEHVRALACITVLLTWLSLRFTLRAIWDRFDRYCRAIERSYLVLAEPEWEPRPNTRTAGH